MLEAKEVVAGRGVVAAWPQAAARVGAQILTAGGNAMDAAAAACLACAVLAPHKNGVGGYMLAAVVQEGRSGRVWSLDANARAPAAASETMYRLVPRQGSGGINENEYDCSVAGNANVWGPLAVAIPGQMAGMGMLSEQWGVLAWQQIVAPVQRLVAEGFCYGADLVDHIAKLEAVIRQYEGTAAHLMPAGKVPPADQLWYRPDMEKTLARLARRGWRDFYDGELGRQIADGVSAAGGILSRQDMAAYQPRLSEPYAISYRGAEVFGPILPNGCLTSLQMLQMLECLEPTTDDQPRYWHNLAEVAKQAWRDRLRYIADPDYVEVPIERLLSKEYAAGRIEALRHFPDQVDQQGWGLSNQSIPETLHVSTADNQGNLVAATITQGGNFGSAFTVPGTGVILGHGMCRLDPRPGQANSVAGGKGPLNNVAPMILRLADRDVACGLPGGRRIINVATQLAQRLIDFDASPYQAAAAPRLHITTEEPLELRRDLPPPLVEELARLGHKIELVDQVGGDVHIAEWSKNSNQVRAGGNGWAAGVE